jgi:phosphoribosyl-ATP pyrophosphohydrolase
MNILSDDMLDDLRITDNWLDTKVSELYLEQPLAQDWARISKIGEEYGEAVQAFIGATGQNPRKGFNANSDDVLDELADVVFTGLCAMQHFTKDTAKVNRILSARLMRIRARVPMSERKKS